MMDLDSFLVSLYVYIDEWWKTFHPPTAPRKPGRPALLSESEVLTLAILAQWPRFRSERDFWRFASSHLRPYFPALCSQSQLNRRVRALEPELRALQRAFAEDLTEPSALYRVMDTTLVPAIVRVRASRKGLFAGQASFGRSASKTEWVYGFKVALVVDPAGVITAFALAEAASDERPIADALIASDRHDAYLADKGFTGVEWERRWLEQYGALVAATPYEDSRRAWSKADRRWASGKRHIIEGVIHQLKDFFSLESHRAKTLGGLLARLAAKVAAYTCAQRINDSLGRPPAIAHCTSGVLEHYPETAVLRQVEGVGSLTALAFVLTLEDPYRFEKSRSVGSYLGLVPASDRSGERDPQKRISKEGDEMLRKLLVSGAHYVLGPFGSDCDLRRHGEKIASRGGKNSKKRAVVAVARKLSVLLHSLWVSGEVYDPLRNTHRRERREEAA